MTSFPIFLMAEVETIQRTETGISVASLELKLTAQSFALNTAFEHHFMKEGHTVAKLLDYIQHEHMKGHKAAGQDLHEAKAEADVRILPKVLPGKLVVYRATMRVTYTKMKTLSHKFVDKLVAQASDSMTLGEDGSLAF